MVLQILGILAGFHTGVDIPQSGVATPNPMLYPCMEIGVVTDVVKGVSGTTPALGNQVQILNQQTGIYYRYSHMVNGSNDHINVGDVLEKDEYLGRMGTTGNSTGVHLHLEASTTQAWNCSTFIDPLGSLGIPNIRDTVIEYDGDGPEPPEPETSQNHWKWWYLKNRF